ncbi:MAG TPA: hypothetical protein DCM41_00060 [Synergistaceae bacterium]|nr:hypothetical protein [Synergistaceae bacterium]
MHTKNSAHRKGYTTKTVRTVKMDNDFPDSSDSDKKKNDNSVFFRVNTLKERQIEAISLAKIIKTE